LNAEKSTPKRRPTSNNSDKTNWIEPTRFSTTVKTR
jgi:hypothetical protein